MNSRKRDMTISYLNHITLTTGHCRKTYPEEIDKDLYFELRGLFKKSLREETDLHNGYSIKSTETPIGSLITLFGEYEGDKVPILTVGCSIDDTGELWELLHSTSTIPLVSKSTDKIQLPYIADRLEVGSEMFLDSLKWTGSFSKCMGWICLAPEKIRK
jgi:hypothetical protein